ncbi:MAG: SUMF1/EgtB/PvdO family nonheme iron enzyme [Vulcanimicrobiota bacterium]
MEPDQLIGFQLSDRLRLAEHLGQGPVGDVFLADLLALKRAVGKCAIKIAYPLEGEDPDELVSEARGLKLNDPSLVNLQNYGVIRTGPATGALYAAVELADESLAKRLDESKTFESEEVEALARGALEALTFLHEQDHVHGHMRPTNLLRVGKDWKLGGTEFLTIRSRLREVHVDERHFIYRAPETFEKDVVEAPSDLWSLGIMLFVAVTGRLPFEQGDKGSKGDLIWRILNQLPELSDLPSKLDPLIRGCLRREPKDRWTAQRAIAFLDGEEPAEELPPEPTPAPEVSGHGSVLPANIPPKKEPPPPPPPEPPPPPPEPRPIYRTPIYIAGLLLVLAIGFAIGWGGARDPVVPVPNVPPDQLYSLNYEVVSLDPKGRFPSRRPGQTVGFAENLGEGVAIEMVQVPGGTFWMGTPDDEPNRDPSESPQHQVTIRSFYMSRYEITQKQWRVMASQTAVRASLPLQPSEYRGDGLPVESVSWLEVQEFCARLTRASGRAYRLPTEAEWEYACRAGSTTPFTFGLTLSSDVANYQADHTYGMGGKGVYRLTPIDVGSLGAANAFGLYDVHGNVWEWCDDFYAEYPSTAQFDPLGPMNGTLRVMRGGGWESIPSKCRSGARVAANEDFRRSDLGFRIVLPEMVYSERP